MIKAIICFALVDMVLSLIATKIPLFRRRNSLRWERETPLQRFCNVFFLSLIIFVICVGVISWRESNSPSRLEKMLESGEEQYFLVSNVNEIGDADIVFEIKRDSTQKEICEMIPTICKEWGLTGDGVCVYPENEKFIIMDNNVQIGSVTVAEKEFGLLLKIKWNE